MTATVLDFNISLNSLFRKADMRPAIAAVMLTTSLATAGAFAGNASLFKKWDENKDGKLSEQEYLTKRWERNKAYKKETEGKTDEQIASEEQGAKAFIATKFKEADANSDGFLSVEEFDLEQ